MVLDLPTYKSLRGINDAERDAALKIALEAADARIRSETGVDFNEAVVTESRDFAYNGSGVLVTPYFSAITAVAINSVGIPVECFQPGPAEGPPYCMISLDARGPSPLMGFTRNLDTLYHTYWKRSSRVTVTATWGWPDGAPGDVKLAAAILADEFAPAGAEGDDANVVAKAIESYSVSYGPRSTGAYPLPPQVAELLEPYTRPRF